MALDLTAVKKQNQAYYWWLRNADKPTNPMEYRGQAMILARKIRAFAGGDIGNVI